MRRIHFSLVLMGVCLVVAAAAVIAEDGDEAASMAAIDRHAHVVENAAVNSGDSGGPLADAEGRVIGVNSQIAPAAWRTSRPSSGSRCRSTPCAPVPGGDVIVGIGGRLGVVVVRGEQRRTLPVTLGTRPAS